eukprot:CAMPEP_0114360860 /NCGR_PEP_ID=MMETSP0101-20121206/24189_1 /TAXON_ID=38822 ORGANISM="Pteridomonas danica, Strain PT" /NCGR_SAMPLE_ID=MMETSP0101 /ASSEMBLY_ACC=CAM_ASM_000211 /LENGTH=165 /DNA_ID=CAMNT_0001505325 /DNA_START=213 /DNA_END=710 /DNA_ORIENTATION=+
MNLCDYLCDYLSTTFLSDIDVGPTSLDTDTDSDPSSSTVISRTEVSLEFDDLKLMSSKKSQNDSYYMSLGTQKGRKNKPKKKVSDDGGIGQGNTQIKLNKLIISKFNILELKPPTTLEQVMDTVKILERKKDEFKAMPKGKGLSIAEMNKTPNPFLSSFDDAEKM